jgi:hypothetical protein
MTPRSITGPAMTATFSFGGSNQDVTQDFNKTVEESSIASSTSQREISHSLTVFLDLPNPDLSSKIEEDGSQNAGIGSNFLSTAKVPLHSSTSTVFRHPLESSPPSVAGSADEESELYNNDALPEPEEGSMTELFDSHVYPPTSIYH